MGKISKRQRMNCYFKIFEQIYESSFVSIYDISQNTGLSRNTVAKYLHEMYTFGILQGPHLNIKAASNYREYVYLLNFSDPQLCFRGLRNFPHVLYHALTFGDWNTMVITDRPLDFSVLVGFQKMVCQGVKDSVYTPKAVLTTWDESFRECHEQVSAFTARGPEYKHRKLTSLPWSKDEWTLFHAFKSNLQTVPGISAFSSLMILGEIGDIRRFSRPKKLISYGGLCPGIYQSGSKSYPVESKTCNKYLKWILYECSGRATKMDTRYKKHYWKVCKREDEKTARRSTARKMLTDIWFMLWHEEPFHA